MQHVGRILSFHQCASVCICFHQHPVFRHCFTHHLSLQTMILAGLLLAINVCGVPIPLVYVESGNYVLKGHGDCGGYLISSRAMDTKSACESACSGEALCYAYAYNNVTSQCELRKSAFCDSEIDDFSNFTLHLKRNSYERVIDKDCDVASEMDTVTIEGTFEDAMTQCRHHCTADYDCKSISMLSFDSVNQILTCRRNLRCDQFTNTSAWLEAKTAAPIPRPTITNETLTLREIAHIIIDGKNARINSMRPWRNFLIVSTETSGGQIWQVDPSMTTQPTQWMDVANAFSTYATPMDFSDKLHGGLRDVAFHPDFEDDAKPGYGKFYVTAMQVRPANPEQHVYLSDSSKPVGADGVLIEFTYDHANETPDPSSYREVFRVGMPVYDHPVKNLVFIGSLLYVAHGDGSVQSAKAGGGQNNDALGKIIRINPLSNGSEPYSVPESNPFVGDSTMLDEVYAIGFRNPHTLCVSASGELFTGSAGRDNVEEVNIVKIGRNYGWPEREGSFVHLKKSPGIFTGIAPLPDDDETQGFTYPSVQLGHYGEFGDYFNGQALAGGCPVENDMSEMNGRYFYSNFPFTGTILYSNLADMRSAVTMGAPNELSQAPIYQVRLKLENESEVYDSFSGFTGKRPHTRIGRGPNGELYVSSKKAGKIYLILETVPATEPTSAPTGQPIPPPLEYPGDFKFVKLLLRGGANQRKRVIIKTTKTNVEIQATYTFPNNPGQDPVSVTGNSGNSYKVNFNIVNRDALEYQFTVTNAVPSFTCYMSGVSDLSNCQETQQSPAGQTSAPTGQPTSSPTGQPTSAPTWTPSG
mmetsp:Transcript_944/g.1796  ORF Transcript_944/g.1796 Transcript_944/m.1796 type:complete len:811 (-) Transcript_944:392-2824(-)